MKLLYEDLLSGEPIFIEGVGHIRSPKIKELNPTTGIGINVYNSYIRILAADKDNLIDAVSAVSNKQAAMLKQRDNFKTLDVVSLYPYYVQLVESALRFFIAEDLTWSKDGHFVVSEKSDGDTQYIGKIDRENYDKVRNVILQMNYIDDGKEGKVITYSTKRARDRWAYAEKYLKETENDEQNESLRLGNIISKLSVMSSGYTLLNIYDLTIYQLYDQFFQCSHLKLTSLNERVWSIHGGDKFKYEDWIKPISKI